MSFSAQNAQRRDSGFPDGQSRAERQLVLLGAARQRDRAGPEPRWVKPPALCGNWRAAGLRWSVSRETELRKKRRRMRTRGARARVRLHRRASCRHPSPPGRAPRQLSPAKPAGRAAAPVVATQARRAGRLASCRHPSPPDRAQRQLSPPKPAGRAPRQLSPAKPAGLAATNRPQQRGITLPVRPGREGQLAAQSCGAVSVCGRTASPDGSPPSSVATGRQARDTAFHVKR